MRISERGAALLLTAKGAYAEHDVYGSDDKDVYGKRVFKVVGAEVDSRDEVVGSGAVICGPAAGKRIALALVAALSSSWPYTSDSLDASCCVSSSSPRKRQLGQKAAASSNTTPGGAASTHAETQRLLAAFRTCFFALKKT